MPLNLADSYAYCERLARREAGNFYHAFRLLPGRSAAPCVPSTPSCASPTTSATAPKPFPKSGPFSTTGGGNSTRLSLAPTPIVCTPPFTTPSPPTASRASISSTCSTASAWTWSRCATTPSPTCIPTATAWRRRSGWRASTSGASSGHEAKGFAESAGIAFQLTNILRDLAEDAARGRVYLPREDLERFGYSEEQLHRGERDDNFRRLMRFEVERARSYYEAARPLAGLLRPAGRAVYLVMARTYRGLLEAIEKRDYDVFSGRVRLSRWHKMWLALQALPVRWGIPTTS